MSVNVTLTTTPRIRETLVRAMGEMVTVRLSNNLWSYLHVYGRLDADTAPGKYYVGGGRSSATFKPEGVRSLRKVLHSPNWDIFLKGS